MKNCIKETWKQHFLSHCSILQKQWRSQLPLAKTGKSHLRIHLLC
ncbi:hypothetical protein P4O66_015430 [Electrophorus voltai]|uniref:Uncharacterized protein n=1 Tax=Electrophorus voltai TaxID=2609070 RepID=A0AAD9DQJ8_9TELE|nr:hypothetical protein P4O66_015430 [Electrophorus voltai]